MIQKVTERPFMPQIIPQTLNGVQQAFSSLIKVLMEMFSQYGFAINSIIDIQDEHAVISLSTDQTANLSNGDHIEFDTIVTNGTLVTLSTGAGQADGKVTLVAGHTYKITLLFTIKWDSPAVDDRIGALIRNNTDSTTLERALVFSRDWDNTDNVTNRPVVIAFLETTVDSKEIEAQLTAKSGTFTSVKDSATLIIEVVR